jgi:hypothetical protein
LIGAIVLSVLQTIFILWVDFVIKTDQWYYQLLVFALAFGNFLLVFLLSAWLFFMLSDLRFNQAALQPDFSPPLRYTVYLCVYGLCILAVCAGCSNFVVMYIIKA